jgi:cysteinyl-tRNA synthetase
VYQLQHSDPLQIAASGFNLAVIDYARDGSGETEFTSADVSLMKKRRDGEDRLVLAYLSIGEAEDYRYYWNTEWKKNLPDWLFPENEEWGGNYPVKFWRSDWQRIIFGSPDAYLDKIIATGFDGVYLDRIDVYWELKEKRASTQADMVAFVQRLAAYARSLRRGFLIVPQNAEGLLEVPEYMATIDGIARESLHYLPGEGGDRPPAEEHEYSYGVLKRAVDAGKFVLTVDYVSERSQIEEVYASGRASGFVPYVTVRALDKFTVNDGLDPKVR